MQLLKLDFETYYDQDYSLKKMPMWQYLRDDRFQPLGCAIQFNDGPGDYLEAGRLDAFFAYTDERVVGVAYNAAFDASVAWHAYGWRPAFWLDPQLMVRYAISQGWLPATLGYSLAAVGEHYGLQKGDTAEAVEQGGEALADYARNDLHIMNVIMADLLPRIPRLELELMDLHVKMAAYPRIDLDVPLLTELARGEEIPEHIAKACRSRATFVELLKARGVEIEYKKTPAGKRSPALAKTDAFMQKLQAHPDPVVRRLTEIRLSVASTIKVSRSQRFLDIGAPLPVPLLYYGAHTGRSSGLDKMNMQNLPGRGDAGRIRQALKAPPGHKFVICDSAQVEVRVLGWLAGCKGLLDTARAFDAGEGPDFYVTFASEVMFPGTPINEITAAMRKTAKPPVLACGFGQGWRGLVGYAAGMGVELGETAADHAVNGYRNKLYPEVPVFWRRTMDEVLRTGQQALPNGRVLTYPDMRQEGREVVYQKHSIFSKAKTVRDTVKLWHGLLTENIVQAVARDVVMWQTIRLSKKYDVVLSVHDEVVMCVPDEQAEQAKADAEHWFRQVPEWAEGMPLAGEAVIADHYTKP